MSKAHSIFAEVGAKKIERGSYRQYSTMTVIVWPIGSDILMLHCIAIEVHVRILYIQCS